MFLGIAGTERFADSLKNSTVHAVCARNPFVQVSVWSRHREACLLSRHVGATPFH